MYIPHYPCFRGIRLEDKNIFQDYFARIPLNISEYTLTNLLIWHNDYNLQWCLWDEPMCMLAQPKGLRKAKQSYHPHRLLNKCTVSFRKP